jgi:DMSO/TMAO reductase YedYZ molybdopterin-dependent catalytic subunit
LTPNEQFYVRTHFQVPSLSDRDWKLRVEGHVERPFEIGFDELRQMESVTQTALLECSGNSRIFLKPPQLSIRWEQGGVSNAEWVGVPLSLLLERAGLKAGAVEVVLEGHDKGKFDAPLPETPGEIAYARSLPLAKALQPEVLLAYQMNGHPLPPDHGFPVRALVGGWYGMASVKWLRRIVVTAKPFHGYFQTFAYAIWERQHDGLPSLEPVTEIRVKAQIARPMLHEVLVAGSRYRIFGAAWCGETEIKSVEISSDGGTTWAPAKLDERSVRFAWRFFAYDWQVPAQAGKATLMARATDARGQTQPLQHDDDHRDAMVNQVQSIEVLVRNSRH